MSKTTTLKWKGIVIMKAIRDRILFLHLMSSVFLKFFSLEWGHSVSRTDPFHNYFQSHFFFFSSFYSLRKQQPASVSSVSLFLQLLLDNHKENINHINDSVHHWNVNLQTNNSDSMDHFSTDFWIWNDLSLSEKNWCCPI